MKALHFKFVLCAALAVLAIAGCGGGSNEPYFYVKATVDINGVYQPWVGASIQAIGENETCTPGVNGCIVNFSTTTGSNGTTSALNTQALPANWNAQAFGDSTCPAGANSGWTPLGTGQTIDLLCAQNVTDAATSPNYYFYCPVNIRPKPTTVNLTATNAIFTTASLPSVTSYDTQGNVKGGPSTATSVSGDKKTLTVPVNWPLTIQGYYVIVARNPSTGAPIAAGIFYTQVYQPPTGCHEKSCYNC